MPCHSYFVPIKEQTNIKILVGPDLCSLEANDLCAQIFRVYNKSNQIKRHMNLIQVDATCTHISKVEIGIEIGSLENELTHKMERYGMTKIHGFNEFHVGRV